MDALGERIIVDREIIREKRQRATELKRESRKLDDEANEMERLLQLARRPAL